MGIYIQYILYSLVLLLYLKCGGGWVKGGLGGGVGLCLLFLHLLLFPTFLKQNSGNKKIIIILDGLLEFNVSLSQ